MAAPKKSLVIVAFAALYVIWGSTYLGIRFSIETIPPFLMAGTRFVFAGLIMYAIAWSQGISKSTLGELAHIAHYRRVFAARRQRRRYDFRTIYRLRIGGADRGDRSDLHRAVRVDHGNGAETDSNYVARARWRFCWRWDFVRPGPAFFIKRRPASGDWNIDFTRLIFHLVGRLALLARCKTCCLTFSHGRSTNALRRNAPFVRGHRDRRAAAPASRFYLHVIGRFIYLSGDHWSCGWIHGLHLAAASLRAGESRHLRVRESDRRSRVGQPFLLARL